MYLALKHLHVACVMISVGGFVARFALSAADSPWMQHRLVRIAPHVVDTLLLAAALGMLVAGQINPVRQPWLLAKIVGLIAYIVFGTFALRRARTRTGRYAAFVAALLAFGYVVSVAFGKHPWPFVGSQ